MLFTAHLFSFVLPRTVLIMSRIYSFEGQLFPSVTTILRETEDKESRDRLRKWMHQMDSRYGKEYTEQQLQDSMDRGTIIHELAENYLSSHGDYLPDPSAYPQWERLSIAMFWNHLEPWLRLHRSMVNKFEAPVFYLGEYPYAGRADLVLANHKGTFTLVDFKTSKRQKMRKWIKEHLYQCTAYALAWEQMEPRVVDYLEILVLSPDARQSFLEDNWRDLIPGWQQRCKDFYENHWERVRAKCSNVETFVV